MASQKIIFGDKEFIINEEIKVNSTNRNRIFRCFDESQRKYLIKLLALHENNKEEENYYSNEAKCLV